MCRGEGSALAMRTWNVTALAAALLLDLAGGSASAATYIWDCKFKSTLALAAAMYRAQYRADVEADAVVGIKDFLGGTAFNKLTRVEQKEVATIAHFAYAADSR